MKSIILSSENNYNIQDILNIANYSIDSIFIKESYLLEEQQMSLLDVVLSLTNKLAIEGIISIEIIDLKLLCEYYLASIINNDAFIKKVSSNQNKTLDINELIFLLKDKEDIAIKNISRNNDLLTISIERISI